MAASIHDDFIQGLKLEAKALKKAKGIKHHEALDEAARNCGFKSFESAKKVSQLADVSPFVDVSDPSFLIFDLRGFTENLQDSLGYDVAARKMNEINRVLDDHFPEQSWTSPSEEAKVLKVDPDTDLIEYGQEVSEELKKAYEKRLDQLGPEDRKKRKAGFDDPANHQVFCIKPEYRDMFSEEIQGAEDFFNLAHQTYQAKLEQEQASLVNKVNKGIMHAWNNK